MLKLKRTSQNKERTCFDKTCSFNNVLPGIPEFMDSGRKCWTLDYGCWTMDSEPWTLDSGFWTLDSGLWMLDAGCWTLYARLWTLDATLWTLASAHWTLSLTIWEQNQNPVSDSAWLNHWKFFGCESLRTLWSRLLCRDYKFWRGCF